MRCKALRRAFPLIVVGIFLLPTFLIAQQKGLSHVRVVRLSYVSGTVGVKRPASTEWAKAQVNTPIQEGFEISTSAKSYAEVEFENGSTARLGEFSKVGFEQLAMDESGNKLNRLAFEQGYATFHLLPEHHDAYSVKIADATLTPNGKSEFRTDLDHGRVRVEVFSGSVELVSRSQTVKLTKDKVLEFSPDATEVALNEKQGIVKDTWDKWTSDRDTQAQLSISDQGVPVRGPLYGWSDLDAYGEWGLFPGFGYGWSPYVSAGWSPYSMGMWSWYSGMGYTWISSEPWGWLPYHYGTWDFSPGFGWFWMPGGFGNWSPALVSWFSGPGWIGWAPQGVTSAAGQSIVTTVPASVIQNGLTITPQIAGHEPVKAGTLITHLPFEPGAGAMLSGARFSASAEALFAPHAGARRTLAPSTMLMGGEAAREQSLHGGFEPVRVRLGTTLGGTFAVRGALGEFRGNTPAIGGAGGPTLVPHGPQSSSILQLEATPVVPSAAVGGAGRAGQAVGVSGGGRSASPSGGHH